ncbi:unnamed protein product [Durusdinium trenchii]|uniref:Uncharacterized protein n=1 Tax=Durusdinium trenchii TaxID=1381693 RepID=A0ABP0PUA5_9DINO
MPLTERELAILAVAVTKMQSIGFRPFNAEYFVEVDQNFGRQTFNRRSPSHCPCLLPNGKYILTKQWRLLSSQEKMQLQGVGMEEYKKYKMDTLSPSQLSNMAGNARSS